MSQEPHVPQRVHVHKAPPPRTLLSGRGRQAFLDERDTDGLQDEEDEGHGTYGPCEPDTSEQLREHDREDDAAHRRACNNDPDRDRAVFAEPVCGDDELLGVCVRTYMRACVGVGGCGYTRGAQSSRIPAKSEMRGGREISVCASQLVCSDCQSEMKMGCTH